MPKIEVKIQRFNYEGEYMMRRDLIYGSKDYIINFDSSKDDHTLYFINHHECTKEQFYEIYDNNNKKPTS